MSNKVKLYTEEQVNKIALQVKDNEYWNHLEITPIEIPSDEEIEKFASEFYDNNYADDLIKIGVKWVIDKIKNKQ